MRIFVGKSGGRRRGRVAILLGTVLLGAVHIVAFGGAWRGGQPGVSLGAAAPPAGFVDDRSCAECHAAEHRKWTTSHHAKAMQRANEATVLGNFNGATFDDRGLSARFFRRHRGFFVNTEGPDGTRADFAIKYTLGVEPLQQYLIEFPGGRLQSLTVAWDTHRRRWFALYPNRKFALDDPLHWTGRYQNWNLMCAECHTTDLRKGYDARSDSYETTSNSLNVGCQACHGPAEAHVAWARSPRRGPWTRGGDARLLVDLASNDARYEVDNCARCHSRRVRLAAEERPGHPLLDEFAPEVLQAPLYHADGQQLGEVYEYGSFRQSRMYERGVRCTDCHDPHGAKPRARGNGVCTRCHRAQPDPRFPTLKATIYDSPGHHFHRSGSPGSACVGCHMPAKTYMIVDSRRDHSFRIPRPDLTAKLGTPNACNSCHTGRSPRWAAAAIRRWYGPQPPGSARYAEALMAGRAGARKAESDLLALAGDSGQPAILRATALGLLHGNAAEAMAAILRATKDPDPVVRAAALSALDRLPVDARIGPAVPLLTDPIRTVRIEAARVLAAVPSEGLAPAQRKDFAAALAELRSSQMAMADMPYAHASLGTLNEKLGRRDLAEESYKTALRMDPYLVRARTSLARLYDATGQTSRAESTLREGLRRTPENGELHYALGLVLAEEQRLADAATELTEAVRLLPSQPLVRYNKGLVLQQMGRRRAAEMAFLRAHELDPEDPQILYALARFYVQAHDDVRAAFYAKRLADVKPTPAGARELLDRLRGTGPAERMP